MSTGKAKTPGAECSFVFPWPPRTVRGWGADIVPGGRGVGGPPFKWWIDRTSTGLRADPTQYFSAH